MIAPVSNTARDLGSVTPNNSYKSGAFLCWSSQILTLVNEANILRAVLLYSLGLDMGLVMWYFTNVETVSI